MKPKHHIPHNKPEPAGWRRVGKVKEPHGLKGDLSILLFAKEAGWVSRVTKISLELESGLKNFNVRSAKLRQDRLIVTLAEVQDRTTAESLLGFGFLIPEELMISNKGETLFLHEILHFTVFDQGKELGQIQGFSSNGPQDLLVVVGPEGRGEIPFVEAFLEKVDFSNKQVLMKLPPGLFPEGALD